MRHHPPRRLLVIAAFLLLRNGDLVPGFQPTALAAESNTGRPSVALESDTARVVVDLAGGAIGEFRLKSATGPGINPLSWSTPKPGDTVPHAFGHFLCLDRWGPPTDAKGARGMPYHGEASSVDWERRGEIKRSLDAIEVNLSARLPLAGLVVRRQLRLRTDAAVLQVREEISNENPLGRLYNAVQHPTIAPPFLDEHTRVDCNGGRGFAQGGGLPNPAQPVQAWPSGVDRATGATNDLRRLTSIAAPDVASFVIEDDLGWITAASPSSGLLIGYVWNTRDYPWVSVWREVQEGKPAARGLEFGTTGLHQPFPVLVRVGRLLERPLFDYLDAGETAVKSYTAFLLPIPADFAGVESVRTEGNGWVLQETRGADRSGRTFSIGR